jgi:hypothetical protein
MNMFKHMFIITMLTVSCNALGMFGFGRELRHYPEELKEIYREEALQSKETREQTTARHEAKMRKANPEGWDRYNKGAWYNAEEIEQEQKNMAQLEAVLAEPAHLQHPVSKQTAQDFAISNQKFENIKTRRPSAEKCPNDRFIKLNVSCPVKK